MKALVSWSGGQDSALALVELSRRFPLVRPVVDKCVSPGFWHVNGVSSGFVKNRTDTNCSAAFVEARRGLRLRLAESTGLNRGPS